MQISRQTGVRAAAFGGDASNVTLRGESAGGLQKAFFDVDWARIYSAP